MRLARTHLVPVLAIVTGGVIGASLSFSFLALSRSDDVRVPERPVPAPVVVLAPVVVPPATVELIWLEIPRQPGNGITGIAAHLVREQHYIEESMKRLAEARSGPGSEAGRRLFERKEAMHDEIADLEREILRLSSGAQGEASDRLNDAANTIDDENLKERVRYSRGLIGIQDREYMREFEAETSRIVEELQEELESASRAVLPIRRGLFRERADRSLQRVR